MGWYSDFIHREYMRLFAYPYCDEHGRIMPPYGLNNIDYNVWSIKCGKCPDATV